MGVGRLLFYLDLLILLKIKNAPIADLSKIKGTLPLLGICYGAQHLAHNYGGKLCLQILENMAEQICHL